MKQITVICFLQKCISEFKSIITSITPRKSFHTNNFGRNKIIIAKGCILANIQLSGVADKFKNMQLMQQKIATIIKSIFEEYLERKLYCIRSKFLQF